MHVSSLTNTQYQQHSETQFILLEMHTDSMKGQERVRSYTTGSVNELECGPKEGRWVQVGSASVVNGVRRLLAGGVLGDGLGSLRNGVLGKLSREDEADSGLDFAGRDRGALVVVGQTGRLGGDPLEDVVHERVHDGHGLRGDTGIGVHLKSQLID